MLEGIRIKFNMIPEIFHVVQSLKVNQSIVRLVIH